MELLRLLCLELLRLELLRREGLLGCGGGLRSLLLFWVVARPSRAYRCTTC
jgi:hypothetical protein